MGRLRQARTLTARTIAVVVSIVLLIGTLGGLARLAPSVLEPFLGPERVEVPEAAFAITLPRDWEHRLAAYSDADWWDPEYAPPEQQHRDFLKYGGVLMSRTENDPVHEQCNVSEWSGADAQDYANAMRYDPQVASFKSRRLELPGGSAVAYDSVLKDGRIWCDYLVTDGERWLHLDCASDLPPEDRWLSIAETLEFLPADS